MTRSRFLLTVCFLLIGYVLPIHATTECAYNFSSGTGNSLLSYCVTVNGNIPQIVTGFAGESIGADGEGYGICNESPAQNYTDYGVSDTGNWGDATLLNLTTTSVKISRTTSDGNWTLTQTINKVAGTSSITVVMALTNNQSTNHVAYLVRYADAYIPNANNNGYNLWLATHNSALVWTFFNDALGPNTGFQLQNVGNPPFGFWEGYAQLVSTGPNACAFAFNDSGGDTGGRNQGSIEVAYAGTVPAHGTRRVTLTYRGF